MGSGSNPARVLLCFWPFTQSPPDHPVDADSILFRIRKKAKEHEAECLASDIITSSSEKRFAQ